MIATFIPAASNVGGIAVNGRYIYWASGGANEVGRANIDGTHVDPNLMTSANNPSGVAVNSQYIYWSNYYGQSIGRANIDGTNPVENFITTAQANPIGVSVDGPTSTGDTGRSTAITLTLSGERSLDGTGQTTFLDTAPYLAGATTEAGSYLYWTEKNNGSGGDAIGRAMLDGSGQTNTFITGASDPQGPAVAGGKIFWGNDTFTGPGTIGVANLDGTDVNQDLVSTGRPVLWSVAADTLAPASTPGQGHDHPQSSTSQRSPRQPKGRRICRSTRLCPARSTFSRQLGSTISIMRISALQERPRMCF